MASEAFKQHFWQQEQTFKRDKGFPDENVATDSYIFGSEEDIGAFVGTYGVPGNHAVFIVKEGKAAEPLSTYGLDLDGRLQSVQAILEISSEKITLLLNGNVEQTYSLT